MFGSFWNSPQNYVSGPWLANLRGIMFDPEHGLLLYAPIAVCALWGWPALIRNKGWNALLPLLAFLTLFCFMVSYRFWHGGYCFGPRYLVPGLPFLMLGLLSRLSAPRSWRMIDMAVLALPSLLINAMGAVPYWAYWSTHPFKHWF